MTETWLILGATSSMARAFARHVAKGGAQVLLAGRDRDDLAATAADAALRGAPLAEVLTFDARNPSTFDAIHDRMASLPGTLNIAVFVGSMPSQDAIDADPALIDGMVADNFTGPIRLLHLLAPLLEARDGGTIIGVSSVAGDRGRLGNYAYGAAKAGFATYLSGLRNRLARSGAHVMTVKPGFVDTAMTWGLEGMFLVASPSDVTAHMLKAAKKGRNVLYTPSFWWLIMTIINTVPEPIFKKLKI